MCVCVRWKIEFVPNKNVDNSKPRAYAMNNYIALGKPTKTYTYVYIYILSLCFLLLLSINAIK